MNKLNYDRIYYFNSLLKCKDVYDCEYYIDLLKQDLEVSNDHYIDGLDKLITKLLFSEFKEYAAIEIIELVKSYKGTKTR